MYKCVKTDNEITLINGVKTEPIATLEDSYGGVAQWGIDDNCYVLYLKQKNGKYKPSFHIFNEALKVLKTFPELN